MLYNLSNPINGFCDSSNRVKVTFIKFSKIEESNEFLDRNPLDGWSNFELLKRWHILGNTGALIKQS